MVLKKVISIYCLYINNNYQILAMFQRILSIGSDEASKWERVVTNPLIKIDKIRVFFRVLFPS